MNFFEENSDGWEVLGSLFENAATVSGDEEVTNTLILWMLRTSSLELKLNYVEAQYAGLLSWPGLDEASDLLLDLGGEGAIDAVEYIGGYTLLHLRTAYSFHGIVLARGPDLYRMGFDPDFTPQEESPTSLAMYSSWAFAEWLGGLAQLGMNLENFIDQELEKGPLVHAGWKKETLLGVFTHSYRPDCPRLDAICCDCAGDISYIEVQPYWRHLIERVKQGIYFDNPAGTGSKVSEMKSADVVSIVKPAIGSGDLVVERDTTGNVSLDNLDELLHEPGSEEDSQGYPAMISIRSECIYAREEHVCMKCWLQYRRTGTRRLPHARKGDFDAGEDSSEDEYSPFLIHS